MKTKFIITTIKLDRLQRGYAFNQVLVSQIDMGVARFAIEIH